MGGSPDHEMEPSKRAARSGSYSIRRRASGPAGINCVPEADLGQIWSNNPQERLNKEICRRTDLVGIFLDRTALIRPVGAVFAEQHDAWIEGRRYLGLDVLARSRGNNQPAGAVTELAEEVTPTLTA